MWRPPFTDPASLRAGQELWQSAQLLASPLAGQVIATIHPSAVLRAPDPEGRRTAYEMLVADLKVAARALK